MGAEKLPFTQHDRLYHHAADAPITNAKDFHGIRRNDEVNIFLSRTSITLPPRNDLVTVLL